MRRNWAWQFQYYSNLKKIAMILLPCGHVEVMHGEKLAAIALQNTYEQLRGGMIFSMSFMNINNDMMFGRHSHSIE